MCEVLRRDAIELFESRAMLLPGFLEIEARCTAIRGARRCDGRCKSRKIGRYGEVDERFKSHAWKACLG
jgi:hypothetical protein